jgi:hypothetical protein
MDFVVLDMQEDMKIALILGRPFLSTTTMHIDVRVEKLNSILMKRKSGLLSSQDRNNAPI